MTVAVMSLEEIENVSLRELFARVLSERLELIIRVSDTQAITIQPEPVLKPLIVLDGFVPSGWKDAIYG